MENNQNLHREVKELIVNSLVLQLTADEIGDTQLLFGPGGLGLDSVDALQLVVALDKAYGLKIQDSDTARRVLRSINTVAEAVQSHQSAHSSNGSGS